ncbi:thioredoxin family protein [Hyphomicrobium nitrativorans]|nr:thioredoxin family protein [Hyphomicrobium nitrativorans]
MELIAFEAPGCAYCPIFRRDVAPSYGASRAGKAAPLRFMDLNDGAADRFKLSSPITVVPTLVLVRDGVEIGRIAGYVGPANVYHILNTMLPPE